MTRQRIGIRVVVVGDRSTGKSSLIAAMNDIDSVPDAIPAVLPPINLPPDFFDTGIPVTIIDTSSSMENRVKLYDELKRADVVVLTYACDQPTTLSRLTSFWFQEFHRLEVKAPVVIVGCKLDLRDEQYPISLDQIMAPLRKQFRQIETCLECSAAAQIQVPEVFYYAQKALLHPTYPIYDRDTQTLKPLCLRALGSIFNLCDHDMDGVLSDAELNEFQAKCFNAPLQPSEIAQVKRAVLENEPAGVNEFGLTLRGFQYLHSFFLSKGRPETVWTVLRKFGYDDNLRLRDDVLPVPARQHPDQSVELTSETVEFLRVIFELYDGEKDGALSPSEVDNLFDTAPESPWDEAPYKDAAEKTAAGKITLNGFLSEWALMTLLDTRRSLANLIYLGYHGNPASTFRVTRRRTVDRKKKKTERKVLQCYVFGPKKSGKSALLNSFLGRPFSEDYSPTASQSYATNVVDLIGGTKKTLILREIPEDGVKRLLANKDSLAACDVALFVYDRQAIISYIHLILQTFTNLSLFSSSDEYSWKKSKELLMAVAKEGEQSGFGVPCLLVAAKDDLSSSPIVVQNSIRVTHELGIEPPLSVSVKVRDSHNLLSRIISAAECPHLSIPESEIGKSRRQYWQLVQGSLTFLSVGAAITIVGLAAYRAYTTRRNSS
ncbi:hypothetical protein ACFE04_015417 [Oxalis oulophora]